MRGPGKYDDLATLVLERADADAAIVIVLGGSKGSGFSVQAQGYAAGEVEQKLAWILRNVADEIEGPSDPCAVCGVKRSKNDGSPVTWRCQVCDRLVCHECTLTILGAVPVEYYEMTFCSRACWERAGRPES